MAMQRSNLVYGETELELRAFFFQAGGQPMGERMVETRIKVSRTRFHQRSQILQVENQPDVLGFLFPLSHLFSDQHRQVQVRHMLSLVSHPYHHDVECWSPQISSFALHAARDTVLEGHDGFLMDVSISIRRIVAPYPWSVSEGSAELVDETLILSSSGDFGDAELVNDISMISLEESVDGGGEFGGVPASKSSVNALEARSFEGSEPTSACVICLEDLEAGLEVTAMPCSHEFHRTCLSRWLEQNPRCPLCRFAMPTVDSSVPHRVARVGQ